MNRLFVIALFLIGGCSSHKSETYLVLDERIQLPITISQAEERLRLDKNYPGRLYRLDTTTCKTISACFWQYDLKENPEKSEVWGVNISVDTAQGNLQSVLNRVEKELDVSFKLDTSESFIPYYHAEKGSLKLAVRLTNGMPYLKLKTDCFSTFRTDKAVLYMTYGLSQNEFVNYVSTDGTHLVID